MRRAPKAHWPVWIALLPLLPITGSSGPVYLAPSLVLMMRLVWLAQEKWLARILPAVWTSWICLFSLSMAGMVFSDLLGIKPAWILSVLLLGYVENHSRLEQTAQIWVLGVLLLTPLWILSSVVSVPLSSMGVGIFFALIVTLYETAGHRLFRARRES